MKYILVILVLVQLFTTFQLIQARHEVRLLSGEVTMHDEMLETLGDDITVIENKMEGK